MALNKTANAKGLVPTPVAVACEVIAVRAEFTLTADLSANDLIQMMDLPAGHLPCDLILDNDALGGSGAVSVGLLNSTKDDIDTTLSGGAAWLTAGAVATAGALRADAAGLKAMSRCAVDNAANRAVAIKITTDTTATSGKIGLTLFMRPA